MVLGRMWRWVAEQAAFAAVLGVLVAAFVYLIIEPGRWGRSSGVVGVAVLLGGVLRALLPSGRVGLLAVRSRLIDSVLYLVLGGVILGLDIRLHQ
ncbi:MAG TPA: DUF3017 domain-containing protein [Jatrophihabitans sp.]|nr:DUF3017 domain-containing protein [Jatrophihabitans sp.]